MLYIMSSFEIGDFGQPSAFNLPETAYGLSADQCEAMVAALRAYARTGERWDQNGDGGFRRELSPELRDAFGLSFDVLVTSHDPDPGRPDESCAVGFEATTLIAGKGELDGSELPLVGKQTQTLAFNTDPVPGFEGFDLGPNIQTDAEAALFSGDGSALIDDAPPLGLSEALQVLRAVQHANDGHGGGHLPY
jgi:hypothetical protein